MSSTTRTLLLFGLGLCLITWGLGGWDWAAFGTGVAVGLVYDALLIGWQVWRRRTNGARTPATGG